MKKFLALILSLAMVFALVACGDEKTDDSQNNDGESSSPVAITLARGRMTTRIMMAIPAAPFPSLWQPAVPPVPTMLSAAFSRPSSTPR